MTLTSNMTAELEKVREALAFYQSIDDDASRFLSGFAATPGTCDKNSKARHALLTLDTIIAKRKATEEALRVAVEGLQDIADVKQHEVESCAYARYYLAKINTILKEPTNE